ncbi:hypothetical protein RIF29_33523 [Crotalaria pallida]|uniref:Uncharacterized protein n=1 Tax=Crotalaria pallida TaxID=3830 RepID=A0AAN9E871_CROPI
MKEVKDALRIRRNVIDLFERASLPSKLMEEKNKLLSFVVVGGRPTGVDFAAELHDFVHEDIFQLNYFDESKFFRFGIDVQLGSMVVKVTENEISSKERGTGQVVSQPHGMVAWSTSISTRPKILDSMKQISQVWFYLEDIAVIFRKGRQGQ